MAIRALPVGMALALVVYLLVPAGEAPETVGAPDALERGGAPRLAAGQGVERPLAPLTDSSSPRAHGTEGAPKVRVFGIVRDEWGVPVEAGQVEVVVRAEGGAVHSATAPITSGGAYEVRVAAPGGGPLSANYSHADVYASPAGVAHVSAQASEVEVSLCAFRTARLQVRVRSGPAGLPAGDAVVRVESGCGVKESATDALGTAQFTCSPGGVQVRVRDAEGQVGGKVVFVRPGEARAVDVRLPSEGRHVRLRCRSAGAVGQSGRVAEAMLGAARVPLEVDGPPSDPIALPVDEPLHVDLATPDGYVLSFSWESSAPFPPSGLVDLEIGPRIDVVLRAVGPDGEPLPNLELVVRRRVNPFEGAEQATAATNAAGYAEFRGCRFGEYEVQASLAPPPQVRRGAKAADTPAGAALRLHVFGGMEPPSVEIPGFTILAGEVLGIEGLDPRAKARLRFEFPRGRSRGVGGCALEAEGRWRIALPVKDGDPYEVRIELAAGVRLGPWQGVVGGTAPRIDLTQQGLHRRRIRIHDGSRTNVTGWVQLQGTSLARARTAFLQIDPHSSTVRLPALPAGDYDVYYADQLRAEPARVRAGIRLDASVPDPVVDIQVSGRR